MSTIDLPTTYRPIPVELDAVPHLSDRAEARILLIEEDVAVANLFATILEGEGYAVTHAATPDEARRLLIGRGPSAFDLVLSTPFTHAPAASYLWFDELCARVRAPIVICARCRPLAYADHRSRGCAAFLEEPFDVEELVDLVAALCPSRSVMSNE